MFPYAPGFGWTMMVGVWSVMANSLWLFACGDIIDLKICQNYDTQRLFKTNDIGDIQGGNIPRSDPITAMPRAIRDNAGVPHNGRSI